MYTRFAVAILISVLCSTAQAQSITMRWYAELTFGVTFEGQFTFPVSDPNEQIAVDLLTLNTNTNLVVSDGTNSVTWPFDVPPPPNDLLQFIYCPGGENQCGFAAPGAFTAALLPTWNGPPLVTDCGGSTCSINQFQIRGMDGPVANVATDVGLIFGVPVTFEIVAMECAGMPVTIEGDDGINVLIGTPGDDVIAGFGGDDLIRGRGGNDTICGGEGNDLIFGNGGDDTLLGESGDDTISAGNGIDIVMGDTGHDVLLGNGGDDTLDGGDGDDRMFGGGGSDNLSGGAGNDRLIGNGDADSLDGGVDTDICDNDATDIVIDCDITRL